MKTQSLLTVITLYLLSGLLSLAFAASLKVEQVTANTFAIVGEIGPRTPDNHALNNTLGFVITDSGVVLVGSGATPHGAKLIEEAVASVTSQPIKRVINIGVQDHHWLGNSHFLDKGIPVLALARSVENQKKHVDAHLSRLEHQVGQEAETVQPAYATHVIDADQHRFRHGNTQFELLWVGDGHFRGDAILWLPESRTVFTGDHVFHDRLLGIHPTTPLQEWQRSFHKIAALNPEHIIPGHGHPGDLNQARRDTGDYLDWLTSRVRAAIDDWVELADTIELLKDRPESAHLKFYDGWHKRNIHQAYMQMESAQ